MGPCSQDSPGTGVGDACKEVLVSGIWKISMFLEETIVAHLKGKDSWSECLPGTEASRERAALLQ